MSDNAIKCEMCLKKDKYQMCPNCFKDISTQSLTLYKKIKQETSELRDSLKDLMCKNKTKSSQLAQRFYTHLLLANISNEIVSNTSQNNSQSEKIRKIQQEIDSKQRKIVKLKEKLKEVKASALLTFTSAPKRPFNEISLQLSTRKQVYLKVLFNIFVINSRAYISIKEYFISNDHYFTSMNINQKQEDDEMFHSIIKYENVKKICSETANGKFIIEDQIIAPSEVFPFKIAPVILKNRIKCIKLNRFLVAIQSFVSYSALKIGICLPHPMNPFCIQSNRNNKTLKGTFEPASMRKNNLDDIMILINLLNQNYNALISIVYDKPVPKEDRKPSELFNLSPLMTQETMNEQLKRSNSELIQLKTDTEVEGFVVLNDYFH